MTYRQTLQMEENKLFTNLSRVYRQAKRDLSLELGNNGGISWSDIQRIYRRQGDDAIKSAVTEIYHTAAKKTVEKDIKIPFFLTEQDMQEIIKISQMYSNNFWYGMEREIVKKTSASIFDPITHKRLELDNNILVKSLKNTFIGRITESIISETSSK